MDFQGHAGLRSKESKVRHVSPKRAALNRRVQPLREALRCEWCGRRDVDLDEHHIAQGYRFVEEANVPELKLWDCRACHQAIHRMSGEDGRAIGLVLIERAGRGRNLSLLWKLTGRNWPSEDCVELWRKRLLTQGSK